MITWKTGQVSFYWGYAIPLLQVYRKKKEKKKGKKEKKEVEI